MSDDFHTTHWTAVLAATGDDTKAKAALTVLCESYRGPVLRFIKRHRGKQDAEDLTHDFFLRVLQGEEFKHLRQGKGRFRSYLLGAVKFFLADQREKASAKRRGGKKRIISMNAVPDGDVEGSRAELDLRFDRDWAEAIVSRALAELRTEATDSGETARFEVLRFWLGGNVTDTDRDRALETLDVSKEHFKVLVSRLRKKFREKIRSQIAQTVGSEKEIAAELDYLVRVLRRPRNEKRGESQNS